ncbi:MAG: hypothetical protein HYU66_08260, partial [Armatimonadetes bacterium]|nr:hypothetical protein [Armatimonadota bacterium]
SLVEHCEGHTLPDLTGRELLTMAPLVVLTLLIGLTPNPVVLDMVNQYTYHLLTTLKF